MSVDSFIDTNVLVYLLARDEAKTPIAEAIVSQGGVISVQVLNELASVAGRKLRMPWPHIREALTAIRELCGNPRTLTTATHEAALNMAERYGFSFYDALIVASALEAKCSKLLTEDLQHGQVLEGKLLVQNPFAS